MSDQSAPSPLDGKHERLCPAREVYPDERPRLVHPEPLQAVGEVDS